MADLPQVFIISPQDSNWEGTGEELLEHWYSIYLVLNAEYKGVFTLG